MSDAARARSPPARTARRPRSAQDGARVADRGSTLRFIGRERRRQHLPDLLQVARDDAAAERHVFEDFVGEPKNLLSIMCALCGDA